jgi:hypothetical protein
MADLGSFADDIRREQFAEDFRQEIIGRATEPDEEIPVVEAFTERMIEELSSVGVLEDGEVAPYKARGMEVSGYSVSDDGSVLSLLVAIYKQEVPPPTITTSEIDTAIRRVKTFFDRASAGLAGSLEESTAAFDMAVSVAEVAQELKKLQIIVITDGIAVLRERPPEALGAVELTTDVWDLRRLHQLASSGRPQESINIDFEEEFGALIPCLPAPEGNADYAVHLAVIPGSILAEVYDRYGSRLLERNVRAFLQARGKINAGIRRTILDEPERFLAYNNGISATATGVQVVRTDDGFAIAAVQDLQIVNGGQTTASLHHLLKRDREKARVDLSEIYVQAKLTIVPPDKLDEIVPLISLYANSQNKVNAADFQANSPFNVAIETLSRSVWAPALPGEPRMTHWFYERARGQYQDALNHELTPARKRDFKQTNPMRQKFTKTDLAKFENCWEQYPHLVSQGAEKNFRYFTLELDRRGKFEVDQSYFERLIAKAVLYKRTTRVVTEEVFGGYRANTVAYTISLISLITEQRLDLDGIWRAQDITPALEETIRHACKQVREVLVDAPGSGNVTEWCKKADCWKRVSALDVPLSAALRAELVMAVPEEWRLHRQIMTVLEGADRPLGKWEIIEEAEIPQSAWSQLIGNLVSQGRVVKEGKTRAARYTLPS